MNHTMVGWFFLAVHSLLWLLVTAHESSSFVVDSDSNRQLMQQQNVRELSCDPCIERPSYTIRAIVHGVQHSPWWQQVRAAARQTALDMRINLEMELYDEFDPQRMASDILAAVSDAKRLPDALIVTIPSEDVHDAVTTALERVPVFGLNSGYDVAESLGLLGFVAMDEYVAGGEAAKQFLLEEPNTISKTLFVNHEKGNQALDQRFQGFQDMLAKENAQQNKTATVEELVVAENDPEATRASLVAQLQGCPYDAVLLSGAVALEHATFAFNANGCTLSDQLLGTFDTSSIVYDAIALRKLSFAVGQQQYLQGALSVVMATTYVTAHKKLARSADSDFGVYFSGPKIVTLRNLPSDSLQRCEEDAFPVCPNTKALDGLTESRCDCTDRTKIRLGGVLHGATTDKFWDVVFAQARQAADDMNVELTLDRLEPEETIDILRSKMASKIISLCQEGVDGIFVSLPNDEVIEAVRECQALSIFVISVNAGADAAVDVGVVHHLAQVEYSAGLGAGQRLIASGMTTGVCLLHVQNHPGLLERCRGFETAIAQSDSNVTFFGIVYVPFDNKAGFIQIVEDEIGMEGDWEGFGALLGGQILVPAGLGLQDRHSQLLLGSFDTSDAIYQALDDGRILFGIDQVPYLQGYLPIPFLTWLAYTKQALVNTFIETGPSFVEQPPTDEQQVCESTLYEVCPEPTKNNLNQLTTVRPVGLTLCAIIVFTSLLFIGWIIWKRKEKVVKASQPAFLIMICIGTLVMGLTIVPLSIDDSVTSVDGSSAACMAVPWLFTTGFVIVFAALFSKIWRINKLLAGAKSFRRLKVTPLDVMLPFVVLLSLNLVFLVVWTAVDPMYFERKVTCGSGDLSSFGVCQLGHTGVSIAMFSCLVALILGALILANIQAYHARKFSTEFSESKYIGIAMIGLLQISFVGIPLIALVVSNPTASFFVRSAIIFVVCMSILLLIFLPKMNELRKKTRQRRNRNQDNGSIRDSLSGSSFSHHASLRRRVSGSLNDASEGLRITGLEHEFDPSSYVPRQNILHLERILKEQGIDSDSLFKEAGIEGMPCNSSSETPPIVLSAHVKKESTVSFAEDTKGVSNDTHRMSVASFAEEDEEVPLGMDKETAESSAESFPEEMADDSGDIERPESDDVQDEIDESIQVQEDRVNDLPQEDLPEEDLPEDSAHG